MSLPLRILAVFAAALVFAACGTDTTAQVAGPGDLGHIHDLFETGDGELLVASHSGLYRITDTDTAVLVGTEQHDLMSMTSNNGTLYASGHPDLRLEQYRAEGLPPHLGLAQSSDGGQTWSVDPDLLGKSDFHALLSTTSGLYAADTEGIIRFRSSDGSWTDRGTLAARDLAVHPGDPEKLVATDDNAQIWVSTDGARTWSLAEDTPPAIEIEWVEADVLVATTEDGSVYLAPDAVGPWTDIGAAPGEVETLHIDGGRWWVTGRGGTIHLSTDGAATWEAVYLPPQR